MNLGFTPEAEQQADECDAWWREHRDACDLFARLSFLSVQPVSRNERFTSHAGFKRTLDSMPSNRRAIRLR
jgi:hypothetical protein